MILGEAFVHVRPDESGFGEELAAKLQGALGSGGLVFGALAVAGAAAALDIGEHFEDAFHVIEQRTGSTGTALAGLEENFKNVFASTPGANFKNVADALSEVEIRTGLTGTALEEMTRKEVELGKITKTDVGENTKTTTALFGLFGIAADQQSAKLDELFKATQVSGSGLAELQSAISAVAPTAQELGLTFDQTTATVAALSKLGIPAQKAFQGLGVEFAKAAKAGKDPLDVIRQLSEQIKNTVDPTVAAQMAIKDFGLSSRSAATLVAGLKSGAFDMGDVFKQITSGTGGIDDTAEATMSLGDKFSLLKNRVLVALEPISMKVVDLANVIVDHIAPAFAGLSDFVSSTFGPAFRQIAGDVSAFFYTLRTGFTADEGTPIEEFALKLRELWPGVRDAVVGAWDAIRPALESFGAFLHDNLQPILIGVGGYIAFLAGSSVIGALVAALGFLVGAVSAPVVAVAALAAAVAYAYQNFDGFRAVVDTTARFIEEHWKPILIAAGAAVLVALGPLALLVAGLAALYARSAGFREFVATIAAGLAGLADLFASQWGKMQAVVDYFSTQVSHFAEAVSSRWAAVAEAAGHMYEVIRDVLLVLAAVVAAAVVAILWVWEHFHDQIISIVEIVWDEVRNVVDNAVRVVRDVIDVVLSLINGDWGDAWRALLDILSAVWDLITTLLGNALALVWQVVQVALLAVGDLFRAAGDAILAAVVAALSAVVSWFAGLGGSILGALGDFAGLLVGAGRSLITGLWNGLFSMVTWLWAQLRQVPGWIVSGIGDIGSLLHDAAVNLVVGFWQGIQSMGSWLMGQVGSFFGGVKDKVLGLFGIGSPSKVFMGYGVNVAEGFAIGLESMAARLTESQRKAFAGVGSANLPDLAGAFQSPGVDLGAGAGGGGGVTAAAIAQLAQAVTQLAQAGGPGGGPQAMFHIENATIGDTGVIPDIEWMMATKTSGT